MNKFLKFAAKIVAGIAIIYLALIIIVAFFIHPDTYKALVTKAMYKTTGRQMLIEGKMSLSIFPWPSISVNKIMIPNPKGFKAPESANYFAKIKVLQVRLFMWPLFKGDVRPSKLLLSGATINLVTSASGKNNWTGLMGSGPSVLKLESKTHYQNPDEKKLSVPKTPPSPEEANLNFPTLFISGANVHFINEQTKQKTDLVDLGLRTKRVDRGDKRLLEISCMIHRNNPDILIRFNTESTVAIYNTQHKYIFNKLRIVTELMKFKNAKRPATLELDGKLAITNADFNSSFKGILRQHSGNINLNVRRHDGLIRVGLDINKLQLEPIVSVFTGTTLIQGILNLKTQLTTRGQTVNDWIARLAGEGQLQIKGGAIFGLDLNYTVQSALSNILSGKGLKLAPTDTSKTSFSEISANYLMKNGVLSTNNLKLIGNQIKADGNGTINFPSETINIKLTALYTPMPKWSIPIMITGNLYAPKIQPNVNAILKQLFKKKLNNGINDTLDNLKKLF